MWREVLNHSHDGLIDLDIQMHAILDNADENLRISAIEGCQIEVMKLLYGYGGDTTEQSTEGESAAILAAKKRHGGWCACWATRAWT